MEISTIIAFVLGWGVEKFFDYILKTQKEKYYLYRLKRKTKNTRTNVLIYPNISIIAEGFPFFCLEKKQINNNITDKKFFLSVPPNHRAQLINVDGFKTDQDIILNYPNIQHLENILKCNNLKEIIEECKIQIAEKFIERKDGCFFNGKLYGIFESDDYSRTPDENESPILHLSFFETDYYTHRVMWEVCMELKRRQLIPSQNLNLSQLNEQFNVFRTSLGISIIVEIPLTNEIILVKRARNTSYNEGKEWIYVSVTETLSETDYDAYMNKINIKRWIKRALFEELGLIEDYYDENSIQIYDMFFENTFYQDGLTASIKLKKDICFDTIKEFRGRDSRLEIADKFTIKIEKQTIIDFMLENKDVMREQTIFSLQSFCLRKNIKITF